MSATAFDLPVSVTHWTGHAQPRGKREVGTWGALLDSELFTTPAVVVHANDRPGWAPSTFRDHLRRKENLESVWGLGLDVDACESIASVVAAFDDHYGIVHTTWSHQREKGTAPAVPRCRVVLALSRAMSATEHQVVWAWAAKHLATIGVSVDQAAKDPTRLWYTPSVPPGGEELYELHHLAGEPVDVDAVLRLAVAPPTQFPKTLDTWAERALESATGRVVSAGDGQRNDVLNREAFALGGFVGAGRLEVERVVDALHRAITANGGDPSKDERKIRDAIAKGAERPRALDTKEQASAVPVREAGAADERARVTDMTQRPPRIEWLGAAELFAPLPPPRWVVPGLRIGPGRPSMLAAYGYFGKSLAAQSLALAVASGTKAWGQFGTSGPARVRHFDHEQGTYATALRYQRLALGHGIDPALLLGRLEVAVFPSLYLTDADAEDAYARELEGIDLAIFDALVGISPGADENSSEMGTYLARFARVSERTGCAILLLHHFGKTKASGGPRPKQGDVDPRELPRGSSAIYGACGTVLVGSGGKADAKLVQQAKAAAEAAGSSIEDFYLVVEDVAEGLNPTAGVRVSFRTKEQVDPPRSPSAELDEGARRVAEIVHANPGCSLRVLRELTGGKANCVDAARDRAVQRELIRVDRARGGHRHFPRGIEEHAEHEA